LGDRRLWLREGWFRSRRGLGGRLRLRGLRRLRSGFPSFASGP
jgi:hypothetical protein